MRHRKYHLPPPKTLNYKSGEVLTFAPSDNEPDPSKMVELIPAGPALLVLEVAPEGYQGSKSGGGSTDTRRAAFLAKLASCEFVQSSSTTPEPENVLSLNHWDDVIADSRVWPALTEFLVRTGRYEGSYDDGRVVRLFLRVGGVLLANYWLTTHGLGLRRFVVEWLRDYWREEWDRLSDEAKRALVQDFAERLIHAEGAKEAIQEIALALQRRN